MSIIDSFLTENEVVAVHKSCDKVGIVTFNIHSRSGHNLVLENAINVVALTPEEAYRLAAALRDAAARGDMCSSSKSAAL